MKIHRLFAAATFVCFVSSPLSSARADAVSDRMRQFVEQGVVSGAVTLVASKDGIVHHEAVGKSDLASGRAMQKDDLFWIASMTKPMTAVCVLILQDEGKLSIEDPVEKYLPEFKGQWLVEKKEDAKLSLIRPNRAITIRDLLTHTGGLGDFKAPRPNCALAELVVGYSQRALQFQPGAQWSYSNPGINTLGRIVEIVSGRGFAEFLQERVFDVLGMRESTFWPAAALAPRIAKSYKQNKDTKQLEEDKPYFVVGEIADRTRTPSPAGGLYSTAVDVAKFYQMMLNGGSLNGKRVLKPETVSLMTTTQSGDLKTGFVDGMSWGLGFQVVREPLGVNAPLAPGTYGHGGAYNTQSWADPKKGRAYILMIQRAGMPGGDGSEIRGAFQKVAAEIP